MLINRVLVGSILRTNYVQANSSRVRMVPTMIFEGTRWWSGCLNCWCLSSWASWVSISCRRVKSDAYSRWLGHQGCCLWLTHQRLAAPNFAQPRLANFFPTMIAEFCFSLTFNDFKHSLSSVKGTQESLKIAIAINFQNFWSLLVSPFVFLSFLSCWGKACQPAAKRRSLNSDSPLLSKCIFCPLDFTILLPLFRDIRGLEFSNLPAEVTLWCGVIEAKTLDTPPPRQVLANSTIPPLE
jgi:hypothetical protein